VLPDDETTSNAVPTSKVVPSNVRLALSSRRPLVPAITIRLSVRSLSVSPAALISLMPEMSELPSSTSALLAEAVPAVTPSIVSSSASLMSAEPITNDPPVIAPVAVKLRKLPMSLFESTTTPPLAKTVPAVTPSSTLISAGVAVISTPPTCSLVALTSPAAP
jgi:hypothetical protein